MNPVIEATIEDLYRLPDNAKAEIVDGELMLMSPTGDAPGYAADEIFVSLRDYVKRTQTGRAVGDNKGFVVDLPNRLYQAGRCWLTTFSLDPNPRLST
jgi:Uma2 family endonuclease